MNFRERTAAIRDAIAPLQASVIRDAIAATGQTQIAIAKQLGISQSHLSGIANGKFAVPVNLASRLEHVLGIDARDLLARQIDDSRLAEARAMAAGAIHAAQGICTKSCTGGSACVLDSDVYHTLHCCESPSCACHELSESPQMARRRARTLQKSKKVESYTRLSLMGIAGRFSRNEVAA